MWFNKHPNWTIFFSLICANTITFLGRYLSIINYDNIAILFVFYAIAIILFFGTLVWSLSVKHRSFFNLFYLLIPGFGAIIIWCLTSKSKPTISGNINPETNR